MDINVFGIIGLCISGLLLIHNAFGESENSANMLDGIRNELNSLKLSNERNERRIMRLEAEVHECRNQYAELAKQETTYEHIKKRLDNIEDKVKASYRELSGRLESVETPRTIDNDHDNADHSEATEDNVGRREKATEDNVGRREKATEDNVGRREKATEDNVGRREKATEDNVGRREKATEDNVGRRERPGDVEDTIGHQITNSNDERSHIDKRIVPVTSRPTINTRIAFSGCVTLAASGLRPGQALPFNSVLANEGQPYDISSHTFTCPVSGVYYFASSLVTSVQQEHMITHIVKDGVPLAIVYSVASHNDGTFQYYQGSNSVAINCNKGEKVWVQTDMYSGSTTTSIVGTTFTGFLVSVL